MELKKLQGQSYYARGKLLLTGEYFVLDGAKALATPTRLGQSLEVYYSHSFDPYLYWESEDEKGQIWFSGKFDFWQFKIIEASCFETAKRLQKVLREARKLNSHFLRENCNIHVKTQLEFPLSWGLGSSSTLVYTIAQWAYVSPFLLHFRTHPGSGYDMACAQANSSIFYQKLHDEGPVWGEVDFNPSFKNQLYFLYLGNKQNTLDSIKHYNDFKWEMKSHRQLVEYVGLLTDQIIAWPSRLETFFGAESTIQMAS